MNENLPDNPQIQVLKSGETGLFTNYIYKAIPLAFDESMSYYETLCGLLNYLKNVIIPTVNNNADAVAELQSLYEQLKSYVDDYFTNLDVQEEINNKLDAMVEDGTLTDLIGAYIDPLINEQNNRINNIDAKVNSATSGSPLVASSISAMTDTTRIYVLTTDGHWYWYNGTTWQDGGIYQASNGILGINTYVVTNNNFSSILPDLNNAVDNMTYLLFLTTSGERPSNLPKIPNSKLETLINIKIESSKVQLYFSENTVFERRYYNSSWEGWHTIGNIANGKIINSLTLMSDLNDASEGIYQLLFSSTTYPENLPTTPSSTVDTLYCFKTTQNTTKQIYVSNKDIYTRYNYNNQGWTDWNKLTNNLPDYLHNTLIVEGNYSTLMPNLNDANDGMYMLLFANNSNHPENLPVNPSSKIEFLISITTNENNVNNRSKYQIYITNGALYSRWKYQNQNWTSWTPNLSFDKPTFYIGANRAYQTLKDGIEQATQYNNSIVYVDDGEYDLYEEFGGDDFFNSYTSSSQKGIILKNGVHIIFSPNSSVIFNYNGNNDNVKLNFSPFNAGSKDFTLENCNIIASNCRYCVHDEKGDTTDTYIHKYINCNFELNDTNNSQSNGACIGCGLGHSGMLLIDSCILNSINNKNNPSSIFIHNNYSSTDNTAKSKVIIKNNYLKNGTIKANWCGVSTRITDILVTNNKIPNSIISGAEREIDVIENIEIYEFNNVINN